MEKRTCTYCNAEFSIDSDDFGFYEKIGVPAPKLCPLCRQQERMLFRNFKTLYKRPSSLSGRSIVSMYPENAPFPVYESGEWWSDAWDPMAYGISIDWSRSFMEQFGELSKRVPHFALMNTQCTLCEYANMAVGSKNCYLVFGCVDNEDCAYGHITWNSRDSLDTLYAFKCESCYECTDCLGSNKLLYSEECESCADSVGLFDCRSCTNCIGCVGLVGKTYHIFNQPVTHEEYKKFIEEHPLSEPETVDFILKKREELRKIVPQRSFFGSHNVAVTGNHIYYAKNVRDSFDVKSGEDSRYCYTVRKGVASYDCGFSPDIEECYQALTCIGARLIGSHILYDCNDVYYSDHCFGSHHLFGCFGLRQKSYCILNKQYTKEEYEMLVPKLKELMKEYGEWGNFLPRELSPFAYNEAIVNEYMPLTKEEALSKGFRWQDTIPATTGQGTLPKEQLPANPADYNDNLAKEILTCEQCQKNYRFIPYEISFYKRLGLSLPTRCFNCRHARRMNNRNPRRLWTITCASCNKNIETSYPPEKQREYRLYCEACYQREML